jgi:hypothetical protein
MIHLRLTNGRGKGIAVALMHGVQQRLSNELDDIPGDVVPAVIELEIPQVVRLKRQDDAKERQQPGRTKTSSRDLSRGFN